jgi:predicted phage terminase large subunit-like protein
MLEPVRFPRDAEDARAAGMGGWDGPVASAQLQQSPAPPGGLIFKKETFGQFAESALPSTRTFLTISVDANFKEGEVSSDCGITIAGSSLEAGARLYVYEALSENLGFIGLLNLIERLLKKYPGVAAILIEDKANGPALIEMLRQKHYNVIAVDPKTSKVARAHAANVLYQGRSVYHNSEMTELAWYEKVLSTYPRGKKKDVVDALSQQLLYLAQGDEAARDAALAQLQRAAGGSGLVGSLGGFERHFVIR